MTDHVGFSAYVEARSTGLLRLAYLLTRDWSLAEDLTQTTLGKAWGAWGRIQADPDPYVRRIMTNTYSSWWRRKWRGETPTGALPEVPVESGTRHVDEREALWRALGQLTPRKRATVVLKYFEDLTDEQIAGVLDCSVGTVKSQLSRALAQLRVDPDLRPVTADPSQGVT